MIPLWKLTNGFSRPLPIRMLYHFALGKRMGSGLAESAIAPVAKRANKLHFQFHCSKTAVTVPKKLGVSRFSEHRWRAEPRRKRRPGGRAESLWGTATADWFRSGFRRFAEGGVSPESDFGRLSVFQAIVAKWNGYCGASVGLADFMLSAILDSSRRDNLPIMPIRSTGSVARLRTQNRPERQKRT